MADDDDCYAGYGQYKCDSCAFYREGQLICANPNIHENPPRGSYFKPRNATLNTREIAIVSKYFED